MSGYDCFDVITNIVSLLVFFGTLLKRSLPWDRLMSLEKALSRAEVTLGTAAEEGLLGTNAGIFRGRLLRCGSALTLQCE